jgi:hypothetical protein
LERTAALALKIPAEFGMFQVDVRDNIAAVLTRVSDRRKSLGVATANALNTTAFKIREQEIAEMKRVFDRPTAFTLNAFFVFRATAEKPIARVYLKEDTIGEGKHYLRPEIYGGPRLPKGFELVLRSRGILPPGMFVVPGSAAKIDAFGNMSRGQLGQIMSALGAAEHVSGYSANRTPHSIKRRGRQLAEYFVGRPGHGLPLGVWQRFRFGMGSAVKPVLIFVNQPVYKKRFDFHALADRVANKAFPIYFGRELRGEPSGASLSL